MSDPLLDELSEEWQSVERAIWPNGPASGTGSGVYAGLKARIIARLAALSTTPAPLDAAWAEAEAALPDGWHLSLWRTMSGDALGYGIEAMLDYGTGEDRVNRVEFVHGPTPAAALLALAEKLREYAKP